MDNSEIINFIRNDTSLSAEQKNELLDNKSKLIKFISGAGGGVLGLALAKYKNMSQTSQIVLSALGFGAGMVIYNYAKRKKFADYNDETGLYEINEK
jgi:F0F1-type ATP synthase assembly protein I